MNFVNIATQAKELPVFTSTVIQRLIIQIANGETARYEGVEYTAAEVNQMIKNQSSGIKPTRVSIYSGDFCMTQGLSVKPTFSEDSDPSYPVITTANNVDAGIAELPVLGGVVDLENVTASGKRYYLPLGVKEDIKQFAALFKYSESTALNAKTWSYLIAPTSVWTQHGPYSPHVPYELLQHLRPERVMSGQDLIEYLYTHKETWGIVRTVIWSMLKDVTVPICDENGEQEYDEEGSPLVEAANDENEFVYRNDTCRSIERVYRPAVKMFKASSDKYQAKMQLDKLKEQMSLSTLLETHNDYYDGIDYSINCDNIRAKMTILHNLDLDSLPDKIGVVTNQAEEFLVMERYFSTRYSHKELIHLTEKSAFNYSGFKIFMKPVSSMKQVEIHDKAAVSRSMQENSSIIASIRADEYPDGLGFMTHPLVAHYFRGQEPREKKGPGEESTYLELEGGRAFKQLDSAMPLHFFPYISGLKDLVDSFEDRSRDVIDDIRTHVWMLINYPVTKATYCESYPHFGAVRIRWTPGKTATSMAFELDSGFKGYVKQTKANAKPVVRPRQPRVLQPPLIISDKKIVVAEPPVEPPPAPVEEIRIVQHIPPPKAPPVETPKVVQQAPLPDLPRAMTRKRPRIQQVNMEIDTNSDVDE